MSVLIFIILGLALGSFVNALVWRVHEQDRISKISKADKSFAKRLSILSGRSMCPDCKHELAAKDLIPIISWVSLKGKCRYCHKPISWQYPLVEMATVILFVASYIWWPSPITGWQIAVLAVWLLLQVSFMALIVYDLRWQILPNRIVYPAFWLAMMVAVIHIIDNTNHLTALVDVIIALILSGGVFYALFQLSNGKWIGGGDVRLGFVLGLIVATPERSILMLFLASALGTLASLPLLMSRKLKRNSTIPFGPFLILAAIIVQLFGHIILTWYQNTFLSNGV